MNFGLFLTFKVILGQWEQFRIRFVEFYQSKFLLSTVDVKVDLDAFQKGVFALTASTESS